MNGTNATGRGGNGDDDDDDGGKDDNDDNDVDDDDTVGKKRGGAITLLCVAFVKPATRSREAARHSRNTRALVSRIGSSASSVSDDPRSPRQFARRSRRARRSLNCSRHILSGLDISRNCISSSPDRRAQSLIATQSTTTMLRRH